MSNAIRYFKALSDETRLRLTYVLERYELSVNELVSILEMGQSRVSRHLKILTEAGLLLPKLLRQQYGEGRGGRRFSESRHALSGRRRRNARGRGNGRQDH